MLRFEPVRVTTTEEIRFYAEEAGVSPHMARLLINRGIAAQDAAGFLDPGAGKLHDPYLLYGMDKAVEIIRREVARGGRITVYGDYDVDGVTATALMCAALEHMGAKPGHYIPLRREGYGLNREALDKLAGTSLLITVDLGITGINEVNYAKSLGMEVVVTDHHECLDILPDCVCINPTMPQNNYPSRISGAGVVAKLVEVLCGAEFLADMLDLVALGTIADVMPLTGENRIFVSRGLEFINTRPRPGIAALIAEAELKKPVSAYGVAFALAPRLNAAGRTGSAETAFSLLTAKDDETARLLASEVGAENRKRQSVESKMLAEAQEMISPEDLKRDKAIVLMREGWNTGVAGIVAARLTERYYKPTVILCAEDGLCVGSARSVRGINMFSILNSMPELFVHFGGHAQAAGMTLEIGRFDEFRRRFIEKVRCAPPETFIPRAYYDDIIRVEEIGFEFIEECDRLAPFGSGNPQPVFLIENARMETVRKVGNGDHFKSVIAGDTAKVDAIAFNSSWENGLPAELLVTVEKNEWKGRITPQCGIKNMRLSGNICPQEHLPKFADAFFERCMYNYKIGHFDKMPKKCANWRNGLAESLKSDAEGTVALAFTPVGAEILQETLREQGLIDWCGLYVSELPDTAYNAALLAPKPGLDFSLYDRVFCVDAYARECFAGMAEGAEITVCGHDVREAGEIGRFLAGIVPDREEMLGLYRVFAAVLKAMPVDGEKLLQKVCAKAETSRLRFALEVFSQLGLIEEENGLLRLVKRPQRELMESAAYAAAVNAARGYTGFLNGFQTDECCCAENIRAGADS